MTSLQTAAAVTDAIAEAQEHGRAAVAALEYAVELIETEGQECTVVDSEALREVLAAVRFAMRGTSEPLVRWVGFKVGREALSSCGVGP